MILLTTNLFKKEFSGSFNASQYEVGMAINCLANIATKELARDCISDLVSLMNHSKPYVRKKAILAMYKLYVKFPQGLRLTFDKLKERLDDPESSVVSTAVNVICELANKNPKNYLAMAPKFFKLLTTSSNNWMLIKVVKLLGSLVTEEPRLARKLLEPLAVIIQNTGAKSLQYECIYTITEALPFSRREDGSEAKNAANVIKLCSDYLRGFIEDADQNLKYLGLVGLCNLMKSSPRSVVDHRDLVLTCLNDDDVTIRTKALELLAGIASKKSLQDLVRHLMEHAKRSEGSYRDEIISKILWMCKKDKYSLVSDFAWYTSVLLDLAVMQGSKHGNEVADQMIEIALRVDTVRPYAVETMISMLLNENLILGHARSTVVEVLKAAAWIVGEYSDIVTKIANDKSSDLDQGNDDDDEDDDDDEENGAYWIEAGTGEEVRSIWRGQNLHFMVIQTLIHARATSLPSHVQIVYIQSAMKVFVRACNDCDFTQVADIIGVIRTGIQVFMQSLDLEVQERATTLRYLLSEFGILTMDWEKSTERVKNEESPSKDTMSLLDLMPVYTASSVRAIDESGARCAVQKKSTLEALIKEKFYAVHSKAQKRVPIPEGLNLNDPFNSHALNKLLKIEIPDNLSLNTVSFVQEVATNKMNTNSGGAIMDEEEKRLSKLMQIDDIFSPESSKTANNDKALYADTAMSASSNVPNPPRNPSDDIFMLNSKKNADLIPLSKLLGEFEEIPTRKSKNSKKKSKKQKEVEVDKRELLPAGGGDASSEDDDQKGKKKGMSNKKKSMDPSEEVGQPQGMPVFIFIYLLCIHLYIYMMVF